MPEDRHAAPASRHPAPPAAWAVPRGHAALLGLALLAACNRTPVQPLTPQALPQSRPVFTEAKGADRSAALSVLAQRTGPQLPQTATDVTELRPERGPTFSDQRHTPDAALQRSGALRLNALAATIQPTIANFEGLSNQDNFTLYGGRVNPPDPVGDVGPNHYVQMINLAIAVFDKQGNRVMGPLRIGDLWAGFSVPDCAESSGDPIVVYDQLENRWILSQFTTSGLDNPSLPFYNCVAISTTSDPTGTYYRYAFKTQPDPESPGGTFFPDYPKYGVWTDSYLLTSRDFGFFSGYGISVYALEKNRMLAGDPKARAVQFFLDSAAVPLNLIGDGLLPADIDGTRRPQARTAAPIVGTQDDGAGYGAAQDAVNIWNLLVQWNSRPDASLTFAAQLSVAPFDSIFPCAPGPRDCLPQPGITNPEQFLDVLSYRQRPLHRLAYRNFGTYDALVTTQSVEAAPAQAGVRWYELRRTAGTYSVAQQGTYAPADGVQRWMSSAAMDRKGNIGLGYSVVNGVNVFPGIRYTGRLASDPAGQMTLGEGTIVNGSGVQRTANSRWGDYSSMNVDPTDDCTLWYVNEYYTAAGQASSVAGWQTRIASFKLPGCTQ